MFLNGDFVVIYSLQLSTALLVLQMGVAHTTIHEIHENLPSELNYSVPATVHGMFVRL